ncbi:MAG TPA: translocation/assembly module TamB domain-containing protein, partial [Polyangiaceae bacterium]
SGLEVNALLKTLGVDASAWGGRVDARLHFEENGRARQGLLKVSLAEGAVPAIGPVQAEFNASVADLVLEGQGALSTPRLGQGKLSARGAIGNQPTSLQSLSSVLGELRLDVSGVELAEVGRRWLPATSIALSGLAEGSVRLAKWEARSVPTLSYELKTRELGLRSDRPEFDGALRHAELSSQGEIGALKTSLQIELKDGAGTWLSAQADQRVGWSDLESVLGSSSPALLWNAPLRAAITARPRSLELLGAAIPRTFNGEVAANVSVTGSPRLPEIEGSLNATGLGSSAPAPTGKLALSFGYSAETEQYSFAAHYAERTRAKLDFEGGGHWGWFENGFGRAWTARAEGRIARIELAPVGDLLGVPVAGEAAGHVEVAASASELEASAELDLGRLALERHALGSGKLVARVHRGLAEAQLSIARADTTLDVAGEVGLCWNGSPCVDKTRGGSLDAKVRNYQLATVAPLLRSVASDLRGLVNGFITVAWDPADATGKRKTRLRADATVTRGSMMLVGGTGSLQCAELVARAKDTDALNLNFAGCARSNRPNLKAKADVLWNGPVPERVDAELLEVTRVPVSFEGVLLGTASVDPKARPIQLNVDLSGAQRTIQASIPALDFELPTKDDTRLVDLTEDPAIHVTDAIAPPPLPTDEGASSPWLVSVELGRAVSIKQPGMRVPVTGTLTQTPAGLLDGSIILPEGGVVPQLGQLFRIKGGSVRFEHQAVKDGVLNIEATTRTVDGIVVELYVSGTVEKPVVRLRSDPPRSENDIVALLLGVQASDTATTNGQQGADLRGSATALAMNQLLRGSAFAGLQFGAGQTHKGDSVSTVSVRATNTVWLEGRTVRSSTQRAANSAVQSSGVIDWRFARGFSLRTQVGNISGLELRWSHRY